MSGGSNYSLFNSNNGGSGDHSGFDNGHGSSCGQYGVQGSHSSGSSSNLMVPVAASEKRLVGRPRKNARKGQVTLNSKHKSKRRIGDGGSKKAELCLAIKPMSHQQRCFAQMHHCFLLRNLEKVIYYNY